MYVINSNGPNMCAYYDELSLDHYLRQMTVSLRNSIPCFIIELRTVASFDHVH